MEAGKLGIDVLDGGLGREGRVVEVGLEADVGLLGFLQQGTVGLGLGSPLGRSRLYDLGGLRGIKALRLLLDGGRDPRGFRHADDQGRALGHDGPRGGLDFLAVAALDLDVLTVFDDDLLLGLLGLGFRVFRLGLGLFGLLRDRSFGLFGFRLDGLFHFRSLRLLGFLRDFRALGGRLGFV